MRVRRQPAPPDAQRWHNAEEGQVHKTVFQYVEGIERAQFDIFNRFVQLELLYDPNSPNAPGMALTSEEAIGLVIENVIASNVDTVTAQIATAEVRARFQTDDGDWSVQRIATNLEYYAEGLVKLLGIHKLCSAAFKECAKKGDGVLKRYIDSFDEIRVEHVRIDDIVVDDAECANGGTPRQLHQRMTNVDREELKARYPEHADAIDRAQTGRSWPRSWAGYRPLPDNSLVAIESWKLPIGRKGKRGYVPGRHTICIDGVDLVDEPWHKPEFPFSVIVWSERRTSFYGISLAERIAGIQRALNKRNWQIDANLDHYAVPITYVDMPDANLQVQSINRIGTVVVSKGVRPTTVTPQPNGPEVFKNRADMKLAAAEDSGVPPMASTGTVPAGIDSGVGVREARMQSTSRFAPQEKAFEQLVLDTVLGVLDLCKELGDAAPVIPRKAKFGPKKIKWSDVDMGDVKVQIAAASALSRTPAGRYQTALEWAQAGVISTDEWRRLTKHPDLDHILSLYTQGMESVERDIEAIRDGHTVVPEPFGNLLLMSRMGQMAYLRDRDLENVPEGVLEGLRQYAVLAADMFNKAQPPAANQNAAPGSAPVPMDPAGPPPTTQPVAALAPQAMQTAPVAA